MSVQTESGKPLTPFGRALKEAGFHDHRGRAKFAMAIGVDPTTVWRWVTPGESDPSPMARRAIAAELKKTDGEVDAMFAGSVEAAA